MTSDPTNLSLRHHQVRIALLEDNDIVADVVEQAMQKMGYECLRYATVAEMSFALHTERFDLLILDWSLPDGEADQIIGMVRNEMAQPTPILIESIHEDEEKVVHALSLGANDYVTKPLRLAELQARVSVLLRGHHMDARQPDLEGYKFDLSNKQMVFGNAPLELTSLEYDLAYYFFSNFNQLLSREQLLKEVWLQAPEVDTRTVDAFVSRLRKKLRLEEAGKVRIRTLRGYGYRLEVIQDRLPSGRHAIGQT